MNSEAGGRPLPERLSFTMCALIVFILLAAASRAQLLRGERCITTEGENGFCKKVDLCKSAIEEISQNKKPIICSFVKKTPIVCCVSSSEPGSRAKKMCQEYNVGTRHKRQEIPDANTNQSYDDASVYDNRPEIIGGDLTPKKMYPHIAAVGFGNESNISWLCGGSLISEWYVMTAAHCLSSANWGLARWVLLGVTDLTTANESEYAQLFSVAERIRHPDYRAYNSYHDIALLKLDRKARIDDYVKPACLHFDHTMAKSVVACGWGLVNYGDEQGSNNLMSVDLMLVPASECNITYSSLVSTKKLRFGVQDDKMVCAGQSAGGKDTCQGDSGGPLQYSFGTHTVIVGVTSFGSTVCGARNSPAIYTRVSHYVPWIEDIVWTSPNLQNTTAITLMPGEQDD